MLAASAAVSAPHRVLYVTTTAGFRNTDSIDASIDVMQQLAQASGTLEIVHTEDLSSRPPFDAFYFFTSGELPLPDRQKADLLDVRPPG